MRLLFANFRVAVYGLGEDLGNSFVRSTTSLLQQLAEVSRDLDGVMSSFHQTSHTDLPHTLRHITLAYHHVNLVTPAITYCRQRTNVNSSVLSLLHGL
jgi:hypothetical protein